jgi:transcription factor SPN1
MSSSPLPEAGNDPGDPNAPQHQLSDSPTPPMADPTRDMEMDDILSDNDSVLSDIDEAQFEDFDPENVAIEERPKPVLVDEDNAKLLGRHKRKRVEGEDGDGEIKKKKKEGRREKKIIKRKKDSDDGFSGGEELQGKRVRKKGAESGEGRKERPARASEQTPENEDDLDPETREFHSANEVLESID